MKATKFAAVLLSTALCGAMAAVGTARAGIDLAPAGARLLHPGQDRPTDSGTLSETPPPAGGAPAAGLATADDVVLPNGPATIRIRHIEVAGSSLSNADLKALLAIKDPKVLEARLRALDAASIVIPEIDGTSTDGTTEVHVTQKDVLLANVKGGRAATGSAAAGALTIKDDKTSSKLTTGASTFKGLDLAQIVHLAAGPRTDDGEPPRPICDEVAIQTVSAGGTAKDAPPIVIATIRATGLKGRPLKAGLDAKEKGAAALNEIAHSVAADLIEADDFALGAPASPATDGLKSLALKHVAVRGLNDGKLAHFELRGLAIEGNDKQPGRLALASAEIDNVAANATPVPSVDRIDLRDFAVDVPMTDKSGQRFALSVARAGYEAPGLVIGRLPAKATLSIEHATFDVPPDSGAAPMLMAMGYKHLDLSSESRSRYDAAAQTLDLDRLSLTGVGMGTLDIKLGLANVSEDIVSQVDAVQKAAAAAVRVKTLDLALRDDGLIDKAIAFKAAADGVNVEQERRNLGQIVDLGTVGFGLQDSPKAQMVVAALHKFIDDPKTLHVSLSSKNGLGAESMPMLGNPQALLDLLDVKATADE